MKFITVRDFRTYPKKIWDELKTVQEMIITNNGKPVALLTPLMEADLEDTIKAMRQAKAKMVVEKMRSISVKKGSNKLSSKELDKQIEAVRKSK
jgi:antitoxin (DNA-binding transcriptional repressor) of toxin-antitoxin stability system